MARRNDGWVSLSPLKGQNSSDNPLQLGEGWATDTENVVIDPVSSLASKRYGSTLQTVPDHAYNIARHQPIGATEENAEEWIFAQNGAVHEIWRKVGGGAFVSITVPAALTVVLRTLSFNGKLFMVGQTTSNRMYVWDGTSIRLVGLSVSVAPTVANTGAGAYPATPRFYKVDWVTIQSSKTVARSELSPAVSFTPSGAGTAARVTKPATLESATHWRVWGSSDGVLFRNISGNIVVGTTTYDDSVAPSAYTGEFPEPVGTFLPPPGVTRIITDGHRILLGGNGSGLTTAGTGETVPKTNRVWFTPVLGSLDQGDDERIPDTADQVNYLDVGDPPTGDILELDGPMDGQIFVFSKHRPWRLIPTGDLTTPYLTYPITATVGAGENPRFLQAASARGETESGRPAIYFVDENSGMYRLTANETLQTVGHDIQSEVRALQSRRMAGMVVWSYPDQNQIWWEIPLTNPFEIRIYVFHTLLGATGSDQVVRGGWTRMKHVEPFGYFNAFILHNRTPGTATVEAIAPIPYGVQRDTARVYTFERPLAKDGNTAYQGYVKAAPILGGGGNSRFRVGNPVLITTPATATNLRVTATRDFGTETRFADVAITPTQDETRVVRNVEGLFQGDVTALEITVGDALATETLWQVDMLTVPLARQETR